MAEKETRANWTLSPEDIRSVFKYLTVEEAEDLCPYLELKEWPAGAVFMREGETADCMGFIVNGKLAVKKETGFHEKQILVALLERGSMTGEITVLDRSARTATVEIMEDSQLLIFSSDNFDSLLNDKPALGIKLLKRILRVTGLRVRQADERLSKLL